MRIYQLHNLMKQPNNHYKKLLHHNSTLLSLLAKRKTRLKYKMHNLLIQQMCWHAKQQLFSTRPPGTNFTLRLNREIDFHSGKAGQLSTGICLRKPIDSHWFNPNLGVLFRGLFWGGWGLSPCLKLVRIMLETWNLARKYKPICSFKKYTF